MFFTAINQMMTEGVDLTLVIRKANGQKAVSVLPKSNGLKDEAQNHIIPLTLKGVPQELDTGFLQAVPAGAESHGTDHQHGLFEAQMLMRASSSGDICATNSAARDGFFLTASNVTFSSGFSISNFAG